jgi:hypothetical protein
MGRLFDRRSMQRRCRRGEVDELALEPVAANLRAALRDAPDPIVEVRHLAAMRAAAAPALERVRRHAASEPRRDAARRGGARRARAVWVALATSIGVAVPSIAAAGALPGPAQHAASRAAAIVHLHVPDTTPKAVPAPHPTSPPRVPVASTTVPAPHPTVAAPPAHNPIATPTTQRSHTTEVTSPPRQTPVADPPSGHPKPPKASPPPHKKKNDRSHHHKHHHKKPNQPKRHHHGRKPPHTPAEPPPFGPI